MTLDERIRSVLHALPDVDGLGYELATEHPARVAFAALNAITSGKRTTLDMAPHMVNIVRCVPTLVPRLDGRYEQEFAGFLKMVGGEAGGFGAVGGMAYVITSGAWGIQGKLVWAGVGLAMGTFYASLLRNGYNAMKAKKRVLRGVVDDITALAIPDALSESDYAAWSSAACASLDQLSVLYDGALTHPNPIKDDSMFFYSPEKGHSGP